MSSEGKVAIVTGGGTGIGKASALALAADGYSVTIAGRRAEPLQEVISEAGEAGSRMLGVQADVGDPESVKNLFAKSQERFGRLDLLFSNAGSGAPPVLFEDLTYEPWITVVNANQLDLHVDGSRQHALDDYIEGASFVENWHQDGELHRLYGIDTTS